MKIMFTVQGEGRGHLTQAIAVKELVERAGHQVVSVVLGAGSHRQVPPFFAAAIKLPVTRIPTLDFAYKQSRQVDLPVTVARVLRNIPAYLRGVRMLKAIVRETQPDIIINFFEPLTGVYALTTRRRPPVLAIAHQFMYGHPDYLRAPGLRLQQFVVKCFVQLVGACSTKLALSLYSSPDLPAKDLTVCPPILRRQLFELQPNPDGKFVLVYLLNHGYAEQITEWHKRNPQTQLHCFYDKPDAPPEFRFDDTLTFHRLDGEKFLRLMAECKFVATTAGFESVSEAAWLGKPLFLMPVENHVEQQINALDATRIGFGVTDKAFNLDRLRELPDRLENSNYRRWLNRADAIVLQTLERTVLGTSDESQAILQVEPEESRARMKPAI